MTSFLTRLIITYQFWIKTKLMKATREFAEHYVKDLFLTFEVQNEGLAHIWTEFLMGYSEEVIKKAWRNIVMECKPRFLPELKRIARHLDEQRFLIYQPKKIEQASKDEKHNLSEFLKFCMKQSSRLKDKTINKSQHFEDTALIFEKFGMNQEAEEIRNEI